MPIIIQCIAKLETYDSRNILLCNKLCNPHDSTWSYCLGQIRIDELTTKQAIGNNEIMVRGSNLFLSKILSTKVFINRILLF